MSAMTDRGSPGDYLDTPELAARLGVSPSTLKWWRHMGKGPRGVRLGRHLRYPLDEVERWERAARENSFREHDRRYGGVV